MPFPNLVDIFTRSQSPPVWSLLVSVFGDLAQTKGTQLSSGALGEITQIIGIKPEATRVALHRLRKEGWLHSERTGRSSAFSLTDRGHAETVTASPRIYSPEALEKLAWLVVARDETVKGGVLVAPNVYVTAERPASDTLLIKKLTQDDALPEWLTDRICPAELIRQTAAATKMFRTLQKQLPDPLTLNPIEIAALRVLIVHTWRQIVLRNPKLPDTVYPRNWTGAECRILAYQLLQTIPAPHLGDLIDIRTAKTI